MQIGAYPILLSSAWAPHLSGIETPELGTSRTRNFHRGDSRDKFSCQHVESDDETILSTIIEPEARSILPIIIESHVETLLHFRSILRRDSTSGPIDSPSHRGHSHRSQSHRAAPWSPSSIGLPADMPLRFHRLPVPFFGSILFNSNSHSGSRPSSMPLSSPFQFDSRSDSDSEFDFDSISDSR